ncbi:MAG: CARDB domain-containing protein [Candidatus Woesearchaeota archaeon]
MKRSITFGIIFLLLIALSLKISSASCPEIILSSNTTIKDVDIKIKVSGQTQESELVIRTPSGPYRLLGDIPSLTSFTPKDVGNYSVEVWQDKVLCDIKNFTALPHNNSTLFLPPILSTDKKEYHLGEAVRISLSPEYYGYSIEGLNLKLLTGQQSYSLLGEISEDIEFRPVFEGNYTILLLDSIGNTLASESFSVYALNSYFVNNLSIKKRFSDKFEYNISTNSEDMIVEFSNSFIKRLNLKKLSSSNLAIVRISELLPEERSRLNIPTIGGEIKESFELDPSALNFSEGELTIVPSGNELWKCTDWNYDAQYCVGSWIKQQNLVPGVENVIKFNLSDPGYAIVATANITSIAAATLSENSFVVAYCDDTNDRTAFKVFWANGSVRTNEVIVDSTTGNCGYTSVSVSALTNNSFVIGWIDTASSYASFAVYDASGNVITPRVDVDTTAGTSRSVSVSAFNSSAFVFGWYDQASAYASFRTFSSSGVAISSVVNVDTTAGTCNAVSVSAVNSSAFVFGWYDQASSDMTFRTYTSSGVAISAVTDVNTKVGTGSFSVSVAAYNSSAFVIVWYDQRLGYVSFRQYSVAGVQIGSQVNPDTAVGTTASGVFVSSVGVNSSVFAVGWNDLTTDVVSSVRTYSGAGAAVSSEVVVQANALKYNALAGYYPATGIGFCNGNFVAIIVNTSSQAFFKAYMPNGSEWDGNCPDVIPPQVVLNSPQQAAVFYSDTVDFNFTVTDNVDLVIPNCTLWINTSSTFSPNITIYNITSNKMNNITLSQIPDNKYIWNVRCYDNAGNSAFASSNFSLFINKNPPQILNPLLNESTVNQSHSVKFNVSITDSYGIDSAYITMMYPNGSSNNYYLNRSGNEFYFIINNTIQIGTYSVIYVWANDTLGQNSSLTLSDLQFNVTPSPPAQFNLLSPPNATESTNLRPNLTWETSYDETFLNYTIQISQDENFATVLFTYYNPGVYNTSRVLDYALEANKKYYWQVIAYDTFGNYKYSTNYFSYITDTLAPSIVLNMPGNLSFINSTQVNFTFTPSDANTISRCTLYLNVTGAFLPNTSITQVVKDTPNLIQAEIKDEGAHLWNILCNDSAGNSAFAPQNFTFISDLNPPSIQLLSPPNGSTYNISNFVNFTINASDRISAVYRCTLIINGQPVLTSYSVQDGVPYTFQYFLLNGNYSWQAECYDLNGHSNLSYSYNISVLVIDSVPPIVTLTSPAQDQYLSSKTVLFNYTPQDATGIKNCTLFIDGNENETDFSVRNLEPNYFLLEYLEDGVHNWTVLCFDNSSQQNSYAPTPVRFSIDTTPPSVILISPEDGVLTNNSLVTFVYAPSDANLENCSLYTNSSSEWMMESTDFYPINNQQNVFQKSVADGVLVWNVVCYDKGGLSSFADFNRTLNVDTTPPRYANITLIPTSPTEYSPYGEYYFNITWIDDFNLSSVYFESNFSGTFENESPNHFENIYYVHKTGLNSGTYQIRWYATDSAKNQNETPAIQYDITKAEPNLTLKINNYSYNLTVEEDSIVNISAELLEPPGAYLSIYINNNLITNGTSPIYTTYNFTEPGSYNVTASFEGSQNYLSAFRTIIVNVSDTTPPIIVPIFPQNNSFIGENHIVFSYNVTDSSQIANCSLFINRTLNQSNTSIQNGINYFEVDFQDGNYSWHLSCYDEFSNYAESPEIYFTSIRSDKIIASAHPQQPQYQKGETAILIGNTTSIFGTPLDTNIYANVIRGNTTIEWWNTSFKYRRPIFINNSMNASTYLQALINISNLSASISNCSELRIVMNNSFEHTLIPSEVLLEEGNASCLLRFNANASALATNENNYYVYYGNSGAGAQQQLPELAGISVQRKSVVGTTTSITDTMSEVNTSRAFLLFSANVASSTPAVWEITGRILSSTQVVFERYSGTTSANISWQVIEGSEINVQRGTASFGATQSNTTILIDSVNLNESFIIITGRTSSTTAGNANMGFFRAMFLNSTAIYIERATTGSTAVAEWQVVSWSGARVQSGNISFITASQSVPIEEVNLSRSMLIFSTAVTGNTRIGANMIFGNFTNSTTAYFSRTNAAGTAYVSWFAVELPQYYSVQAGTVSITADTNVQIYPVRTEKTFHLHSASAVGATSTTYSDALIRAELTNSSNLMLDKVSGTNTNYVAWFVVEEKYLSANSGMEEALMAYNYNSTLTGLYTLSWVSGKSPVGNYTFVYSATKTNYSSARAYSTFEIIPDTTPPNVTLVSPLQLEKRGVGNIIFSYIPYDLNLLNCTLYLGKDGTFSPNITSTSPINNAVNNLSVYLDIGLYTWNVLCRDSEGNSAFALQNRTLNITGPDLYPVAVWFSNTPRIETVNTTIFVNISNKGLSDCTKNFTVEFRRSGLLIGNLSVQGLLIGEVKSLNSSFLLGPGINNLSISIDPDNRINESDESNNNAYEVIAVEFYQYYYGNLSFLQVLSKSSNESVFTWENSNPEDGVILVADIDSKFEIGNLRALTRNANGDPVINDLSELDEAFNSSNLNDSIKNVWGNGTDIPIMTANFTIGQFNISNVPVAYSRNSTSSITGILWDSADDLSHNLQYDSSDREDIVLITKIHPLADCSFGSCNYEIRIPAALRSYKPNTDLVVFYTMLN